MAPPRCCPQALRRPGPLPPAPYAARRAKQWVRTGTTGLPSPASGRSGLSPRSIGKKGGSFLGVWTAALLGLRGPSRRRPALGKARRGGQKGRWTLHCVHPAVPLLGPLIGEGVAGRLAPGREGGRLQAKQAQGDPLRGRRGVTTQRAPAHVRPPGCLSDQLRVPCLSHQWQRGRGGHHLELESSRTPVLHRGSAVAPPTWKAPSLVPHEPGASRCGPWMGSACLPRSRGPACLAPCVESGAFPSAFRSPFLGFPARPSCARVAGFPRTRRPGSAELASHGALGRPSVRETLPFPLRRFSVPFRGFSFCIPSPDPPVTRRSAGPEGMWRLGPSARGQAAARSPEPGARPRPRGGVPASPSRRGPVYGDLPRGARTVRGPQPPRLARPSRPPFPLLLRRLHFHSPVRLKLSHPVSHPSWTFQNWEERFAFLTVSVSLPRLATLVSLRSWPVPRAPPRPRPPSSAAPAGPRAVPTWGCVSAAPFPRRVPPTPSLVLRCRTPSSYLSRRGPVFWSGRPCVCECGFMRCWVVSEAHPRCSPSSRDSARLRVQTPSPRLPSGRCGGLGV